MNEETTQMFIISVRESTRISLRDCVQTSETMYALSILRQKWAKKGSLVSAGLTGSISQ